MECFHLCNTAKFFFYVWADIYWTAGLDISLKKRIIIETYIYGNTLVNLLVDENRSKNWQIMVDVLRNFSYTESKLNKINIHS